MDAPWQTPVIFASLPPECNIITVFLQNHPLSVLSPCGLLSGSNLLPRLGVGTNHDQTRGTGSATGMQPRPDSCLIPLEGLERRRCLDHRVARILDYEPRAFGDPKGREPTCK